jgi:BirA family biotin operon repressor/biotin-[acetyl-CoA-carboxylase] ligase
MSLAGRVRLVHLDRVDSTNRVAADAARAGRSEGLVVVTDYQTAGRGRLGRRWEAPPGSALLASMLLRPTGLAPERSHLVTSAVGLAAVAACRSEAGVEADLKWPNDLLIGERKLAGILAERVGDAVVVGLGLNLSVAPPGAATLDEAAGRRIDRDRLLDAVIGALDGRYDAWDEVASEYARSCATVGQRVRAECPGGRVLVGTATGVDLDGRLVVVAADGGEPVALAAADVTHLRCR